MFLVTSNSKPKRKLKQRVHGNVKLIRANEAGRPMDKFDYLSKNTATQVAMSKRMETRAMQVLLGICSGIAADQQINDAEIKYLSRWLKDNEIICDKWPASAIHYKIEQILQDGIITQDERNQTLEILKELTQNNFQNTGLATADSPVMPIDKHAIVLFDYKSYCFTGEFLYGTRAICERAVLKRNAIVKNTVTRKLDFLVIGSMCSPHWINETYGHKISNAMEIRKNQSTPIIISEQQWTDGLINQS